MSRILVAMSGGIDSTIAAVLLHEQGHEVIGVTMKTWDYHSSGGTKKETGCCSLDSINDARNVAVKYNFPHYIIDLREEFGNKIIDNFVSEYMAGRTPNPCVLCNTFIKWEALLQRADKLNCAYIATGHYAGIRCENGRYIVSRGRDENKDQSYVLWGISQENLARTVFPLANYKKQEVRQLAHKFGMTELTKKNESYEICFIPDNDYRSFLKRRMNGHDRDLNSGKMTLADGTIIGAHEGYPYYTIGQRKGLKVATGNPNYVTSIDPVTNTVVLGPREHLLKQEMAVKEVNLVKYDRIPDNLDVLTKIRYRDKGAMSAITQKEDKIYVHFHKPVTAITPGQSAVFYEGDDLVGGGIIE
ncbi:MAG: tRNA 2-thiouridine(34) synthase MnmA [Bacteroidetes bacterium]|nr:tRNA 2-thiouridine(34) synthase MnmA [Bacteroidota bacterium]